MVITNAGTGTLSTRAKASVSSVVLPSVASRSKLPPILTGVLLVLFGGLLFLWLAGGDKSVPVVMMARDVPRGHEIVSGDIVQAHIESDVTANVIPWNRAQSVIGATAAGDLVANSFPAEALIIEEPVVPAGTRAVGLVLVEGQLPTERLGIGDVVDVIHVGKETTSVVSAAVPIQRLVRTEGSGGWWVTLIVPEADADAVAKAGQDGAARLSKVGEQ